MLTFWCFCIICIWSFMFWGKSMLIAMWSVYLFYLSYFFLIYLSPLFIFHLFVYFFFTLSPLICNCYALFGHPWTPGSFPWHMFCYICISEQIYIKKKKCVGLEAALRRMISVWHQSTARAIREQKIIIIWFHAIMHLNYAWIFPMTVRSLCEICDCCHISIKI